MQSNRRACRLGVVTPLANEIDNIQRFMDEILQYLSNDDRWYCILDNVSTDGTREIVEARSKTEPRLVFIWSPQNRCLADAFFCGYEEAYAANCNWILEIDGGFSYSPAKIPEFIAAMEAGYDYAVSSRFTTGGAHRSPWTRRFLSYGASLLAKVVLGSKMTDMTGGFECFNRSAMEYVLKHRVVSRANGFHLEIKHMMHRFKWVEIPIVYNSDQYRVGRPAIRDGLKMIMKLAFRKSSGR